jgi:hypothetical protein
MITYDSELEKKLFASLTVKDHARVPSKQSVRFHPDTHAPEKPSRKKPMRDSQKSRQSVGLPGSKRHNRYRNKMDLLDKALSDSESELEIEVEFHVEFKSPFSVLFTDEEVKRKWEPFVEVTEEEESEILNVFYPQFTRQRRPRRGNSDFAAAPQDCFNALNRDERKLLRKQTGNPKIVEYENIIIELILSRRSSVSFNASSFDCLLAGLICVYYALEINAEQLEEDLVAVQIKKPKGVMLPSVRLSEYLVTLQDAM